MNKLPVKKFQYGIIDSIEDSSVPRGAASDSLNWVTEGNKVALRRGQTRLGATENTSGGKITGFCVARRADGVEIPFRTRGRKVEYYDSSSDDWVEIGTNTLPAAAEGENVTFAPYQSVTGAQLWLSSPNSSLYKIMVANPGNITDMYDSTKNFKGYIRIKQNRMFLWHRKSSGTVTDKTGLYGSHIDKDEAGDFTQISAEAIGLAGSLTYSGTLAFKAAGAKRTCFEVTFTDGSETFIDDLNGNLVGSAGGTGTINYTTGAYSVTFASAAAGAVTATYRWEDSTSLGIADFTKSTPRTAGEGFVLRQDDGGDFQNLFSINDTEYCVHTKKTWALTLTGTDTSATNLIFRSKVGIPFFRAGLETSDGIYYIDDQDENDPHMRLLTFAFASTELVPKSISKSWKINNTMAGINLADYRFEAATMFEYGDLILVACRHKDSDQNDTVFAYNKLSRAIDRFDYSVSEFQIYDGSLVAGDSLSGNVYVLFSGYSDEEVDIPNHWGGGLDNLGLERLKRSNGFVLDGEIGPDQKIKVSISLDNGPFVEVGGSDSNGVHTYAIEGSGAYVDRSQRVTIGALTLGRGEIGGGGDAIEAYHYRRGFKLGLDKFENAKIKFEAVGMGYASVSEYVWDDIRLKAQKLPSQYRT